MRLNCMSRLDGLGYLKCMKVCKEYCNKNSYARPMFDDTLNCICNVCGCNCTALYYRDQSSKLAIQAQNEREDNYSPKKVIKLSTFINSKPDVFDMSRSSMKNVNDKEKQDDVISRTAIGITNYTDIQDNVKLRLELQRER